MRVVAATIFCFAALCFMHPTKAQAATPHDHVPKHHPGHRHAEYPNLMGSKMGYVSFFAPHQKNGGYQHIPLAYASLFYERVLVHNWLEVELAVGVGAGTEELGVPIDLYFKKPFHPSDRITPYIAIGPHLDALVRPERVLLAGACVATGAYFWLSKQWGLDLDVDYAFAAGPDGLYHDVLFAIGPTGRF